MFNLLGSELFRLRKRAQSWVLFVITLVISGAIYGGFAIAARVADSADKASMQEDTTFSSFSDIGIGVSLGFIGALMLIILSAGMMGNEYSWNTLRPLVARSRSRASLLTAKYGAALIYAVLFTVLMTLAMAGLYFIGPIIADTDNGFTVSRLMDGFGTAFTMLVANLPYMALAFMLATVFRGNVAGIAGALGVNFLESAIFGLLGLASSVFRTAEKYGIAYNSQQLVGEGSVYGDWKATIILMIYTAIFVVVTYMIFLRRDVTSG